MAYQHRIYCFIVALCSVAGFSCSTIHDSHDEVFSGHIGGTLIDKDGRSIVNANIELRAFYGIDPRQYERRYTASTDESGAWSMQVGGSPPEDYVIIADHPDHAIAVWPGNVLPLKKLAKSGTKHVLPRGKSIPLTVQDTEGHPLPNASARYCIPVLGSKAPMCRSVSTGPDGIAEILLQQGGECSVRIFLTGYRSEWTELWLGETDKPIVLALEAYNRLVGVIVDADGRPVEGARVELFPDSEEIWSNMGRAFRATEDGCGYYEGGETWYRTTGADGRFSFLELECSAYEFEVTAQGFEKRSGSLHAGGERHSIIVIPTQHR